MQKCGVGFEPLFFVLVKNDKHDGASNSSVWGWEALSERFLKWAVKRYYRSLGYEVRIARIRLGNTEIDGEAVASDGVRIAIEVKTPSDDLARGLGQLGEALASGYNQAVLVTTLRRAKQIGSPIFNIPGFTLLAVDSKGKVHAMAKATDAQPYLPGLPEDWLTKPSIDEMKIKAAIEKLRKQAESRKATTI